MMRQLPEVRVLLLMAIMMNVLIHNGSAMAQDRRVPLYDDTDLLILGDLDGTVGMHLVNWGRDGLFTGIRFSAIRPEGELVSWSAVNAETTMGSTFRGYGQEQYLGLYGGFAFHQRFLNAVMMTGIGIVKGRRFREYYDEAMGEGHEIYWMRDRQKKRYLLDFMLSMYHRGDRMHVGFGFSLATRSLNAIVGFPISLDTLRNG